MHFGEYLKKTRLTDSSNCSTDPNYLYYVLGLCGETGEVAEKIKKLLRDNKGVITEEFRQALKKELGDIQWYSARIADLFDIDYDDMAETNINKLLKRKEMNLIHGNGDERENE